MHPSCRSWLADLERLRDAAAASGRPKVTILDVADRAMEAGASAAACQPTSPRSVEACLRLGIDPAMLVHRPLDFFVRQVRHMRLAISRQTTGACAAAARKVPSAYASLPAALYPQEHGNVELAQLAFDFEESKRQERLKALIEERRRLEDVAGLSAKARSCWPAVTAGTA